jgi:hypothetical protein
MGTTSPVEPLLSRFPGQNSGLELCAAQKRIKEAEGKENFSHERRSDSQHSSNVL